MRYTVILVPDAECISVSVPAMPGCVSQGRTREEALVHIREAIAGWIVAEAEQGRGPLDESADLVAREVSEALQIIEEMREAGELREAAGFELELASVELSRPVAV